VKEIERHRNKWEIDKKKRMSEKEEDDDREREESI
jgi:hypothetical protein